MAEELSRTGVVLPSVFSWVCGSGEANDGFDEGQDFIYLGSFSSEDHRRNKKTARKRGSAGLPRLQSGVLNLPGCLRMRRWGGSGATTNGRREAPGFRKYTRSRRRSASRWCGQ